MSEVTELFSRIQDGDGVSSNELFEVVYSELRGLAHKQLKGEPVGQSLQTTSLVNEAYIRLVGSVQKWRGRAHFFGAAAEAMRRILVDRARARQSLKRGHGWKKVELTGPALEVGAPHEEVLAVSDAFDRLAEEHPQEAEVAKLRYFAGFNTSEAARALEISVATAHRRWTFARAWLIHELRPSDGDM